MYNIDDYLKNEEELENNTNSFLQNWKDNPVSKIEKLLNFIKVLEFQDKNCEEEIKRMQDLKKSNEKKIENIKKYIATFIEKPTRIGVYSLSTRKSESVEILDETKVPQEFLNEKITFTVDKKRVKDFLEKDLNLINEETGEVEKTTCDWAKINYNTNLIIK